jgi:hypothetical protein
MQQRECTRGPHSFLDPRASSTPDTRSREQGIERKFGGCRFQGKNRTRTRRGEAEEAGDVELALEASGLTDSNTEYRRSLWPAGTGTGTASAGTNGQQINYYSYDADAQCTAGTNQNNQITQICTSLRTGSNLNQDV